MPDILAELATVQMHAIQTSGACIRSTTTDHFAGVAADEVVDPRPWCELIRQWSTFHPEFAFLPRKFKIAVCGSGEDRAATLVHDIGVHLQKDGQGKIRINILAGGGLGRTPVIGAVIKEDLEPEQLKILVKAMTPEVFAREVETEWHRIKKNSLPLSLSEIKRMATHFTKPDYESLADLDFNHLTLQGSPEFQRWLKQNALAHQQTGYSAVTLTLKATSDAPGDVSAEQLDDIADLADRFSFGELRVSHEQNLIFADVPQTQLPELWQALDTIGLATPNHGLLTDVICCPGGDYCALANARTIPLAEEIQRYFEDLDYLHDIGELDLNISGCMNACAHHHVGHIGILGVDRKGEEYYQIQIGGSAGKTASLGKIIGPSFKREEVPDIIRQLMSVYLEHRYEGERFIDTSLRLGLTPFKEKVYGQKAA